jgi:hypothetical protein
MIGSQLYIKIHTKLSTNIHKLQPKRRTPIDMPISKPIRLIIDVRSEDFIDFLGFLLSG